MALSLASRLRFSSIGGVQEFTAQHFCLACGANACGAAPFDKTQALGDSPRATSVSRCKQQPALAHMQESAHTAPGARTALYIPAPAFLAARSPSSAQTSGRGGMLRLAVDCVEASVAANTTHFSGVRQPAVARRATAGCHTWKVSASLAQDVSQVGIEGRGICGTRACSGLFAVC